MILSSDSIMARNQLLCTQNIFRQINLQKSSFFTKTLIWRKICDKIVAVKFRNFYSVVQYEINFWWNLIYCKHMINNVTIWRIFPGFMKWKAILYFRKTSEIGLSSISQLFSEKKIDGNSGCSFLTFCFSWISFISRALKSRICIFVISVAKVLYLGWRQ